MTSLSIYVPCYNGEQYIARCVESILAVNPPIDDILVVDDGSTDRTAEIVRTYDRVRLISHEKNKGLAAARNSALRAARHEFVASIDADVRVDNAWHSSMIQLLQEFPEASAYAGRLQETVFDTLADKWRSRHMVQEQGVHAILNVRFVSGANGLVKRSRILEIGGFDERMRTNGEDGNICHRLRMDNRMIIYDPKAVAYHMRTDNLKSILRTHWAWFRHPWVVLVPVKTWRDLLHILKTRLWPHSRLAVQKDWNDRDWPMLAISLASYVHNTWRETHSFLRLRYFATK